jgi:hypothetical protein
MHVREDVCSLWCSPLESGSECCNITVLQDRDRSSRLLAQPSCRFRAARVFTHSLASRFSELTGRSVKLFWELVLRGSTGWSPRGRIASFELLIRALDWNDDTRRVVFSFSPRLQPCSSASPGCVLDCYGIDNQQTWWHVGLQQFVK